MKSSRIEIDAIVAMLREHVVDPDLSLFQSSDEVLFLRQYISQTGELPPVEVFRDETGAEISEEVGPWSYYLKRLKDEKFVRESTPKLEQFNATYESDPKRAILELRDSLVALSEPTTLGRPVSVVHDTSRWEHFKQGSKRIPTGLEPLDEASGGLSSKEDFVVISARLGIGKSWVAHAIGANMCLSGYRVGLYSGEMSEDAVGARFDSLVSHISNYALTRGKPVDLEEHKTRLQSIKGDLIILTPSMLNHDARPSDLRRFIKENDLQCLIIDQLDQMSPDGLRGGDDIERKKLLSLQLRSLQLAMEVPVILVHQLNRNAATEEPDASHLAGSDQIGRDATLVLALTKKDDTLKMKVLKARFFRVPDQPWEFTWDIDKGILEKKLSAMDAVKAKVKLANARQKVKDDAEVETQPAEEEDIW